MPEGDVLRLTAARLGQALGGRALDRAELRWGDVDGDALVGTRVIEVVAYGKHLLVRVDAGLTLHTHLRMEGSWSIEHTGTDRASARSPSVRAVLANPQWTAVGHRLGMLDLVRTRDEHTLLGHLGPDVMAADLVIDPTLVREHLQRGDARDDVTIAEALLDQTRVAGIGTIYTAEGLFAVRLDPWTAVRDVPVPLLVALLREVRAQMWASVDGGLGSRARHVHARAGRPCVRCGARVAVRQARQPPYERPIFFCPRCQQRREP